MNTFVAAISSDAEAASPKLSAKMEIPQVE